MPSLDFFKSHSLNHPHFLIFKINVNYGAFYLVRDIKPPIYFHQTTNILTNFCFMIFWMMQWNAIWVRKSLLISLQNLTEILKKIDKYFVKKFGELVVCCREQDIYVIFITVWCINTYNSTCHHKLLPASSYTIYNLTASWHKKKWNHEFSNSRI